ncbi:MAG: hypothetical protein KatS3mg103_1201 [Phycisphaerales bacterium]|nr:MAG: hypothetical protein KatS3mg103_1201 [Phycisphaerales bacterium]
MEFASRSTDPASALARTPVDTGRGPGVTPMPSGGLPLLGRAARDGSPGRMHDTCVRLVAGGIVAAVLTVLAVLPIGGCVDQAAMRNQIHAARQDLGVLRGALAAREQALRQALEDPSAPAELVAGWHAQLAVVREQLAATDHALAASAEYDQQPGGVGGVISRTVGAVAPLVPEPYRLPLILGAGLAASLARAAQLRRAGRSIARGVQRALDADPVLAERFAQHAGLVRQAQPPLARRLVDEAQGKRAVRPI